MARIADYGTVPVSKALDRLVEPNRNIHRQDFVFYKTEWISLHGQIFSINWMYFNKKCSAVIYFQDPKVFGPQGSGFRNVIIRTDPAPAPSINKQKNWQTPLILWLFNNFISLGTVVFVSAVVSNEQINFC